MRKERTLMANVVEEWTPEKAASYVAEAWQNAVESIIETGRRLIEAKQRVGHGRWLDAVERMPFSDRTAQALMQIAKHPDLSNPQHVAGLPPAWGTLSVLAQLPEGEIPKRIETGEITPELDRSTAQSWVSVYSAAKQEYLNAYSQGLDGLLAFESYTQTYKPPREIPGNYPPVSEVVERLEKLADIWTSWRDER